MAQETKPAWNWRRKGLAHAPETVYSEADIERIARILGVTEPDKITALDKELQDSEKFYLVAKGDFDGAPRPAEILAALRELRKHAEALRSTLQRLDDETRRCLSRVAAADSRAISNEPPRQHTPSLGDADLSRTEAHIDKLIRWAEEASEALPQDKGGRPLHGALRLYVAALASLFREFTDLPLEVYRDRITGDYGPFRDFVRAALIPLDPHTDNTGLDRIIREVLTAVTKT